MSGGANVRATVAEMGEEGCTDLAKCAFADTTEQHEMEEIYVPIKVYGLSDFSVSISECRASNKGYSLPLADSRRCPS